MTICGINHSTDITWRGPPPRLLDSTRAETAMLAMLNTWPMPICCRGVGRGILSLLLLPAVNFLQSGQRVWLARLVHSAVEINENTNIEPAGIWKPDPATWRSVARAWRTVRLIWIPIGVAKMMLVDHSGSIFISVLRSSTCWTVHSFHGLDRAGSMSSSVFSAARFSTLHKKEI
ncbi:hypothetical protein MIMGU_mgv1a014916mg [Erythranthe guttata]|uniref:Uncharacterized protein n=1 Tax=Erythranthe guttata TaxID=4155 RepID=A0A022RBA7_ERYGU|nr:hypothetical protein MIMGU_mgv1a014916mg [Erythranthe guttata]